MNRKFLGMLLALLMCLMMVPCAMAEEEIIGYGELELYSEGAFPNPPEVRRAKFAARGKTVQQTIYDGLMAQKEKINIYEYGILIEDVQRIFQDIINNEPDLFFIGNSYKYSNYPGEETVVSLIPTYLYTGAELESEMAAYNSAVNAIVADARKADTTVGQLLRANEYFCLNFEYDNSLTIRKANEFFRAKKGVCQAYTLAYKAVCDRLGITSTTAVSSAMNHIWNMVNLGGEWYHVDVTWNDPTPDRKLFAHHKNFLRSDSGISSTGHHSWAANYQATSKKYDSVGWRDLGVPLSIIEDKVYYTTIDDNSNVTIHCCDLEDLSDEELYSFHVSSYSSWGVPCCTEDDRVYFPIGHEIYSVDNSGQDYRLEFTFFDKTSNIRSMLLDDEVLTLRVIKDSGTNITTVPIGEKVEIAVESGIIVNMKPKTKKLLEVIFNSNTKEGFYPTAYSSDNPLIVAIDEKGEITANLCGQAMITAEYFGNSDIKVIFDTIVHCDNVAFIPKETKEIRREAFAGMPIEEFVLPEGVERIETGAFAGCNDLLYINLPGSLTYIAADAFNEESGVTLIVTNGTYAHEYAQASGMNVAVLNPEVTETPETPEATENGDTVTE